MKFAKRHWLLFALALLTSAFASPVLAQEDYPTRPIRLLVPFAPGGAGDTVGRTIGEQVSSQLGQPIIIDNRPGAGGRVASKTLAKATPNGYTLMIGTPGSITISPTLYKKLDYDVERDIMPLSSVAEVINVLVTNPASGARDVKEFIDWAKKQPNAVKFGSTGTGVPDHLAGEFFQRLTQIRMLHVPYQGGAQALIDLLSGDLQLMFATYVVAAPHLNSGKLRALAVATAQRQPLLPGIPAVAETVPGFALSNWNGVFAPARTPRRIADRLVSEIKKALLSPEVKRRLNNVGIEPHGSSSQEDFARFIRADTTKWASIIRDAGIRVE